MSRPTCARSCTWSERGKIQYNEAAMKITLTGATGFIGTLLVERLKRAGHELTIVTRKVREGTNPRFAAWDARDAFEGCDAVIHLAGEPVAQRWTPAVKNRIR